MKKTTLALALLLLSGFISVQAHAETLNISEVAVEINGTKIWLPSTIIAKKGDTIKIRAVSKIPGPNNIHGFSIDAFKIQALVTDKPTNLEFVANKVGIFPIHCHLHPAHIGGQLVINE